MALGSELAAGDVQGKHAHDHTKRVQGRRGTPNLGRVRPLGFPDAKNEQPGCNCGWA